MTIHKPVKVVSTSELEENGGIYKLESHVAIKVYGSSSGGKVIGGARHPVYVVSDADISSGKFKVQGGSQRFVSSEPTTPVSGFVATPVYVINGSEWPSIKSCVLDEINDVTAAYSLRQLRCDYNGSAVRVRRSSDNNEQDIGFDGNGDFDTAAINAFLGASSGFLHTWYDQSGNGNDATQATNANQPIYISASLGGKPSFDYQSNQYLLADSLASTYSGTDSPLSMLTLLSFDDPTPSGNTIFVGMGSSSNNTPIFDFGINSPDDYLVFRRDDSNASASLNEGILPASETIYSIYFDGQNARQYEDGAPIGPESSIDVGAITLSTFTIGALRRIVVSGQFDGKISELILLDSKILTTNHNLIGQNIANYYNTSWQNIVLDAPTNLTATTQSSSQIDLSWIDNATEETGYTVQRSIDNIVFNTIATLGANETSYSDIGLLPSTLYYYRVRAFSSGENSAWSNTASDTTDPASSTIDPGTMEYWQEDEMLMSGPNGIDSGGFEHWQEDELPSAITVV